MKHRLIYIAAAIMTFVMVSCGKNNENGQKEPTLSILKSELSIPGLGGEATVEVESASSWSATVDKNWLSCAQEGTTVRLSADKNLSLEARYATLTVKNADEEIKLSVVQLGQKSSGFNPQDISTKSDAAEFKFPYQYETKLQASTEASWITLEISDDCLTVRIAENTTPATADDMERTAQIDWILGVDFGTINVLQRNVSFMKEDNNWTVEYQGVNKYEGKDYEFIAVNVADPAISGKYGISLFSKKDFVASKMEMEDYISEVVAPEFIAETDEAIEYFTSMGMDATFADFIYEDSDYEIFSILSDGDYYGVAIGFTDDAKLTGHYAYSAFTKKTSGGGGGGGATGYEAWLGDWTDEAGSTWTISQKSSGKTYTISGIEGITTLPIEGEYDAASNALIVRAQTGLGSYEDIKNVGYYGIAEDDFFYFPGEDPYVIFTARISSDGSSANLVGEKISTEDGVLQLVSALYIGEGSDGYYSLSKSYISLPSTIKRAGGNGGGDTPGSGSAEYNKFIGPWSIDGSDGSTWTTSIRQDVADKSFKAYGWQGWTDDWMGPAKAEFKDGAIVFMGGTGEKAASNVQIDESGNLYDIYYMGRAEIDGKVYVITSGDNMYDACQGKFDSNGNIVLTGLDVELSNGGTYAFVDYSIVAMTPDQKSIYTFKNMMNSFPVTMKKGGSGSSVKHLSLSSKNAVKIEPSQVIDIAQLRNRQERIRMSGRTALSQPRRILKNIAR